MEKINMSQLIRETAQQMGCYKSIAKEIIQKFFLKQIHTHLIKCEQVDLSPFGVLYLAPAKTPKRDGAYRKILKFRASKNYIKIINGEKEGV